MPPTGRHAGIFTLASNLDWWAGVPGEPGLPERIARVYLGPLLHHGTFNEIHNRYKRRFFRRKRVESKPVGIWGWNTWCGIQAFPVLVGGAVAQVYKDTVAVGYAHPEPGTGLLPHAVLHGEDGAFAARPTYKCYGGAHGEAYNLDNILCWTKLAMEYFLVTGDAAWFRGAIWERTTHTIDYVLDHCRAKFNPALVYAGVEGDWTECTDWTLDNANVTANLLRTLQLADACRVLLDDRDCRDYASTARTIVAEFNKDVEAGGFWSETRGHYVHGNSGDGAVVHGDAYFESTVNYFSLLWRLVPADRRARLWAYITAHEDALERPYPVLTNLGARTGARRPRYGRTVTNGDVWLVLGAHAAAARLQGGYRTRGTAMYRTIVAYERAEGTIHNCIYQDGRVNDSWDPEIGNYGALFAPFVFGVLGLQATAPGIDLHLAPLAGLRHLRARLFLYGRPVVLETRWDDDATCTAVTLASPAGSEPEADAGTSWEWTGDLASGQIHVPRLDYASSLEHPA